MTSTAIPEREKNRDRIAIPGDYQLKALESGGQFQRAWHRSRLNHLMNVERVGPGDNVVDLGCGSGIFLDLLAPHAGSVVGIDSNPEAVAFCGRRFAGNSRVRVLSGTLERTGLAAASVDLLLCQEVLEHVYFEQIPGIFAHWLEILKPGGRVFITTPNQHSIWPVLEYVADRLGVVAHMSEDQHVTDWSRGLFCKTLGKSGFTEMRSGTFNLFSPLCQVFGGARLGQAIGGVESRLLRVGGPLLWVTARRP